MQISSQAKAVAGELPGRPALISKMPRAAVLAVILVTAFAFAGALEGDFVNWDDKRNLVQNEAYQGLGLEHIRWMFTTAFAGHYQPLTWLSFAIDWRLHGLAPWGFHLTSLLLHVATSVGFLFVARRLLAAALPQQGEPGLVLGALAATLLFAVHPLRVESVAWATERRDVLSGVWLMVATLLYLRAVQPRGVARCGMLLALACVCYVLSLLSKAAGITWPLVLLILDIYPLRRLTRSPGSHRGSRLRRILLEKALFACPAMVIAVVALWAQADIGALRTFAEHPLCVRVGQACYGLTFYLWKTLCPVGLVPLYEQRPDASALDLPNMVGACVVVSLTALLWALRRRAPACLAVWAAYVVTVSPVLGLAQSGPQIVADRYSYLSCLSWAVLAGGAVTHLWAASKTRPYLVRFLTATVSVVVVGVLVLLTRSQTHMWADSYTLWTTTLERAPDTPTAHSNLAVVLNEREEYELARDHCRKALRALPGNRSAHIALPRACVELGDLPTAEEHYQTAIDLREVIGEADPATMVRLAYVKSELGDFEAAERLYRSVIELDPDTAAWHHNLAGFLASRNRQREAAAAFREALRVDPAYTEARFRLAVLLLKLGEPAEAIATLEEGLTHAPDDAMLNAKLAWVLSTCKIEEFRNGQRGLVLARRALEYSGWDTIVAQEALAAALAETGDFLGAAAILEKLLAEQTRVLTERQRGRAEAQVNLYRHGKPLRE